MDRREEAQRVAEACIKRLKERFAVKSVSLCGSLAGEGPWHSRSDIDLVVEGLAPEDYIAALTQLWELLPPWLELDLICLENAPSGLVRRVRGEEKMPEDPKQALAVEIREQLESIERVVQRIQEYLPRAPVQPPELEIEGVGKLVHDFYTGWNVSSSASRRGWMRMCLRVPTGIPICCNAWKARGGGSGRRSSIMPWRYAFWNTCASAISFAIPTATSCSESICSPWLPASQRSLRNCASSFTPSSVGCRHPPFASSLR